MICTDSSQILEDCGRYAARIMADGLNQIDCRLIMADYLRAVIGVHDTPAGLCKIVQDVMGFYGIELDWTSISSLQQLIGLPVAQLLAMHSCQGSLPALGIPARLQ